MNVTDDRQTTDGRAIAYSERERKFTFANNYAKNLHLRTIAQLCRAISSQLRHVSTIGKMLNGSVSSICLYNMVKFGALAAEISWRVWGTHPTKFQPVSRFGFVTAATSLNGGQPNFARCLAVYCTGTLQSYAFLRSCPLTEFCQLLHSLCVQVLHSPILAALLHGTRAAAVSQTLWRGNYGTFADGATYIRLGGHRVGHRPTF